MIVKVKEPQPQEIALLEPRHLLFTYLHLAADKPQAEGLMKSGATCIAYETVTARDGVAAAAEADERGRRAACRSRSAPIISRRSRAAAACCSAACRAWRRRKVAILGGGVSGVNAAQMAVGMRADVTIYDITNDRLAELDMFFSSQIKTAYASKAAIADGGRKRRIW